jgi:hypothetical protein
MHACIVQSYLVDIWRLVVESSVHIQVIAALERNGTGTSHLLVSNGTCKRYLASHGCTADDGFLQAQLLDKSGDASDVRVLCISVFPRPIGLIRKASAVSWKIKSSHAALLAHAFVVEHAVVLAGVAASGVQEDDVNVAFAGLLVEDFAATPEWRGYVGVSANNVVVICVARIFLSVVSSTLRLVQTEDSQKARNV